MHLMDKKKFNWMKNFPSNSGKTDIYEFKSHLKNMKI